MPEPARSAHLHVIVLAAGASRRFGSPKQLSRLQGQPLLLRVLACATELAGPAVTVVLGAHAAQIAASMPAGSASLLINRGWQEGMASSIRAAILSLPGSCDGALILLADQPLVTAQGLRPLLGAWRKSPASLVASQYGSVTGVPAIFPRHCFPDLLALRGDQGARLLLNRYADRLVRVPYPEAAVDIDQPEDLLELSGHSMSPDK